MGRILHGLRKARCRVGVNLLITPGEVVVDPFMGSGSTGVAALRNGRLFAGCDIDQKAIGVATERLKADI